MLTDPMVPSATLRILLDSIEEVMGQSGAEAVLRASNLEKYINNYPPKTLEMTATFSEYAAAQQGIEDFYGKRGARAIMLRIGRATFQFGLRDQPTILGLNGIILKALPEQTRMKFVLNQMAKALSDHLYQPSYVREEADAYYFIMDDCPCRWRPKHDKPCGYVAIGSFMEAMAWATGKVYRVDEVACICSGAGSGVFRIPKEAD